MPYEHDESLQDMQQYGDRINTRDDLLAGGPDTSKKVLFLMPKTSGGSAEDDALDTNLGGVDEVIAAYGPVAGHAYQMFRAINALGRVDAIAVPEADGSAAAAGSIKFVGNIAADGTLVANLAGYKINVTVSEADTPAEQATALAAAVTADTICPWSAAVDGVDTAKVNLTHKYKGEIGNSGLFDVDLIDNADLLGGAPTIVDPTGGSGNPVLDDYLETIQYSDYRVVYNPFTDNTSVEDLEATAELMSAADLTGGAMFIHAFKGTASEVIAWAAARNSWAFCCGWMREDALFHQTEYVAAAIEAGYQSAEANPSVPFHQQERVGLTCKRAGIQTRNPELENVVRAGASPYTLNDAGTPIVHTCVTTCTTLDGGVPSTGKSSPHKFYTAIETRRFLRQRLDANNATSEQKRLVDGKADDIRGCIADALKMLAGPDYQWLSQKKLDQVLPDMVVRRSTTNLQRTRGGAPVPIVEDHRGTDLTMWLVRA